MPNDCPNCNAPLPWDANRCPNCGWREEPNHTKAAFAQFFLGCGFLLFGAVGACSLVASTDRGGEPSYKELALIVGLAASLFAILCVYGMWRIRK